MAGDLNLNSWEPLYSQISDKILYRIENELKPGDQIPSENMLIAEYRVSRNTVRQAIELLIKKGRVFRLKGRGTFVAAERMQYGLFHLVSFTEEIRRRGMMPSSRLLSFQRLLPPPKISQALNLIPEQQVFLIERLRSADGKPMALNSSYLPCHLCPSLDQEDLETGSIYEVIENKYNLRIGFAQQMLRPTLATDLEAELLQIVPGSAMLEVEGTASLADGTPIEYARLLYRGDRYEFPIFAVRKPEAAVLHDAGDLR
jgi:GntR family transcriptional regulator